MERPPSKGWPGHLEGPPGNHSPKITVAAGVYGTLTAGARSCWSHCLAQMTSFNPQIPSKQPQEVRPVPPISHMVKGER